MGADMYSSDAVHVPALSGSRLVAPVAVAATLALVLVGGCEPGETPVSPTPTPSPVASTGELGEFDIELDPVLPEPDVGERWTLQAELAFGESSDQLGTGGPDRHGPPGLAIADDRFYVLDVHKRRVAIFSLDGSFESDMVIPGEFVDVRYPHVLDDGRLVAPGDPMLVVDSDGVVRRLETTTQRLLSDTWTQSDGTWIYAERSSGPKRLSVRDGQVMVEAHGRVETRSGRWFRTSHSVGSIQVATGMGDEATSLQVELRLGVRGVSAEVFVHEVAAVESGVGLPVVGLDPSVETRQVGAWVWIDSSGDVVSERLPNPYGARENGTPHHLVVDDMGEIWFHRADEDALRIYRRI